MIIPYTKINKAGESIQYWTHSSFVDEEKFKEIQKTECTRKTYRNYITLLGGIVGLKLSTIPAVSKLIPKTVPSVALAGATALLSYAISHTFLVSGFVDNQIKSSLESTTIPLWKSKQNVVNLQRAFFHLDETKHNQIDLLHHGLTPENGARIFPDLVSGTLPKAPEKHGHGHSHGEDKSHGHH